MKNSSSNVVIDIKTAQGILVELQMAQDALNKLRRKVLKLMHSKYGSDVWWEKEIEEGLKDLRDKKVYGPFSSAKNLIDSLHRESARI